MTQLTKNFRLSEFDSRGELPTDPAVLANIHRIAQTAQVLRDFFGAPITIISAWRSKKHNAAVKGARNSRHMKGDAIDFRVKGKTPREVFAAVNQLQKAGKIEKGGLHAYDQDDEANGFTHLDGRGWNARW